jgi:glucan 1,3-beta-glucosidase
MRLAIALLTLAAAAVGGAWTWLGAPVEMPQAARAAADKLDCVSYAPFRADQDPFGPDVPIDPRQIEEDLTQLHPFTDCVRTYSVDHGLDAIPEIAARHGMKVMQGLWLSNRPELNRYQIDNAVALAKRFPQVIEAVVVGNEVLLRGEMAAPALAATLREVKAQISQPVTYADVWEFWLRNRDLAAAADFVTVHILPYWEDFPLPAELAARHVQSIRAQVVAAFPGKDVLVGEFGWPSAGRMREGALPSRANQARTVQEVWALAKAEKFRVNIIEAYDQPWKRQLEGAVGGHWGLFDAYARQAKFTLGAPVSNHPQWRWQALAGVVLVAAIFGVAGLTARGGRRRALAARDWLGVAVMAAVAGTLIGWTAENVPLESLTLGDWLRSLAWALLALAAPIAAASALAAATPVPSFRRVLGRRDERVRDRLALSLGALRIALTVLGVAVALGLTFDPRYRDFPFAPLTGAAVAFVVLMPRRPARRDLRLSAETVAAATLALSAIYIVFNESFANWQALWFCAGLLALAVTLLPGPAEQD